MEHGLLYENVMNINADAIAPNTGANGQTGSIQRLLAKTF